VVWCALFAGGRWRSVEWFRGLMFLWGFWEDGVVVCLSDKVLYGYGVGCGRQAVFGIGAWALGPAIDELD
jgi:hypothetical protein